VEEEAVCLMADRKQRARERLGTGITFKGTTLVMYFFQLGSIP
jgi:hypothetical protein